MTALTARQLKCLTLIAKSVESKGYPPTLKELATGLGIVSTNGIKDHLNALERKGFVKLTPNISRGISLTEHARDFLEAFR